MPNELKLARVPDQGMGLKAYLNEIKNLLENIDIESVITLKKMLNKCWCTRNTVFLLGNGGSEANATHLANDFLYGLGKNAGGVGLKAISLSANCSVLSAIANDDGYKHIFSKQLKTLARSGDILLVFSGSGNSENIITCIQTAKKMGLQTAGFLGFDGGKAKEFLDVCVHSKTFNMQASEDIQIILGHAISRDLCGIKV